MTASDDHRLSADSQWPIPPVDVSPRVAPRTGAAAGHPGHYHEALCYRSDEELLASVVSFVRDGLAANEPTIVALGARHSELLRSVLPACDAARIVFLDSDEQYNRPAVALENYRRMLAAYITGGASQIRLVGEVPMGAQRTTWDWWARYEATVNHAFDGFPLWSLCAYDARISPPDVVADVLATHPRLVTAEGHHTHNDRYVEPAVFLGRQRRCEPDPLQATTPAMELVDPTPADVRARLARLPGLVDLGLPAETVQDLLLAVTEVVTNALLHGQPPVTVRAWCGTDRCVITVHDHGSGLPDPYAGLLPAAHAPHGGVGLWFAHQTVDHVSFHRGMDGFTVRLVVGDPYDPTRS